MNIRTVSDYSLSHAVITSRAFESYPMADIYRELSARLGHDFSPAIMVLDRLPPFMKGAAHKQVRRTMAHQNTLYRPDQVLAVRDFLQGFASSALRPGQELDLMDDFARPLFDVITRASGPLGEIPPAMLAVVDQIPSLFSLHTPLRQRLEINQAIAAVLATHGVGIVEELGLMVLGVRPLTASIALSLHQILGRNPDTPLSAVAWPDSMPVSGIRYLDRICTDPALLHGESFAAGERVRCAIQSTHWTEDENQALSFGSGAHACPGRSLSLAVWKLVTGIFADCGSKASTGPLVIRERSDPFELPHRAPVRFHA